MDMLLYVLFFFWPIKYADYPKTEKIITPTYESDTTDIYNKIIDTIMLDSAIRRGLCFLLDKKNIPNRYMKRGVPKFKVSNYTYPVGNILACATRQGVSKRLKPDKNLGYLSNCQKGYKFLLFFSEVNESYIECTVVNFIHKNLEDNFWLNTRFGRVMTIQCCVEDHKITLIKVNLKTAG